MSAGSVGNMPHIPFSPWNMPLNGPVLLEVSNALTRVSGMRRLCTSPIRASTWLWLDSMVLQTSHKSSQK